MLMLVETQKEKANAQKLMEASLRSVWNRQEKRTIIWRPSSREMTINHNGAFWFTSLNLKDTPVPRYWFPFGEYQEEGGLVIGVEANVPTTTNSLRVAGFFAKDSDTGATWLMHDGGVGGGRKGIGRAAFLWWADTRPISVENSQGKLRQAMPITRIDAPDAAANLSRFVHRVLEFKKAVSEGAVWTPEERQAQGTYQDYFDEFSGKKRRGKSDEVEYVSRHGDIVRALRDWRQAAAAPNESIVKNAYIDLGITTGGVLTEIYEVKTNCDRQTLYSAIGQILVHDESHDGTCERFVVLPNGALPNDILHALDRSNISVVRFNIDADVVQILPD